MNGMRRGKFLRYVGMGVVMILVGSDEGENFASTDQEPAPAAPAGPEPPT